MKISAMTLIAAASITGTDRLVLVDDISGTPATFQVALSDLRTKLLLGGGAFSSDPLAGISTITTTGAINGQTISATAAFTGTVTIATGLTVSAGTTAVQALTATTGTFSGPVRVASGQVATTSGVAATAFALTLGTDATYLVVNSATGASTGSLGVITVSNGAATVANLFTTSPAGVPSISGSNLQFTQSSGSNHTLDWSYIRIR